MIGPSPASCCQAPYERHVFAKELPLLDFLASLARYGYAALFRSKCFRNCPADAADTANNQHVALHGSISDGDRSFVAQQHAQFLILQNIFYSSRQAIDVHLLAHQTDAVAVIDVPIDVADVERLYRLAVGVMPAVDGDAVRFFLEAVGEDDAFLIPAMSWPSGLLR